MKAFLKPTKPKQIVRHPDSKKLLKAEGEKVELTTYWRRRILDGSVVEAKAPSKPATSMSKTTDKNTSGGKN